MAQGTDTVGPAAEDIAAAVARLRQGAAALAARLPAPARAEMDTVLQALDRIAGTLRPALDTPVIEEPALLDRLMALAGPQDGPELLRRLDEDLGSVGRQLTEGLARLDGAMIRAATHVLTSLAGSIGAQGLSARARALNDAVHAGAGPAQMATEADFLTTRITALRAALAGRSAAVPEGGA